MALTIKGGNCNDPVRPTTCNVLAGSPFILSVDVLHAPRDGYILLQTFIDYGLNLTYKKADDAAEEMVWPHDVIAVRSQYGPGLVGLGGLTGFTSPLPPSFFLGNVVELLMNCSSGATSTEVVLLPDGDPVAGTSGTVFRDVNNVPIVPNVGPLTINCVAAGSGLAETDSDGDGCTDLREAGLDELSGGQRDASNPWDFYDVNDDQIIDLPNDILGVIQHFSSTGQAPYDVRFDRGPSLGPHPWSMSAPDGVIDLPNDVLGVIAQFGHSCQ